MASKTSQALNRARKVTTLRERGTGSDAITLRLRELQTARAVEADDVELTIQALVPAAAAACAAGHLVSLSKVRGGCTVLFRIRDGEYWLDWFCADEAFAAEVAEEIVKAFQTA